MSSELQRFKLERERSEPRGRVGPGRLCRTGGRGACPSR
jgi:hypothetical protein